GFAMCTIAMGCATTHSGAGGPNENAPAPHIASDEEFGDARADYTALRVGSPARAAWRKALLGYLLPRVSELLQKGNDDAVEVFKNACSLFDAAELDKPDAPPEMLRLGEELATVYARRGAEEPVVLGRSVAATLNPAARAQWDERIRWIQDFEASAGPTK